MTKTNAKLPHIKILHQELQQIKFYGIGTREQNRLKRDSRAEEKNKSTEMLLQEKDEEIKKMQMMLQQMQAKLQATAPDTQVWAECANKVFLWEQQLMS